ncbi:hypothetical protein [Aliiroseovarius crassostreae]|uniref:hypothetical protein n=1 Tax=Aliiroseovarius crassostreae TaxID=154981 RepID=UPI0022046816|nr:hypothetical protein [Aliiroseovarius crassostreae]UWQ04384.1 hypothetical protein K3X22_11990 [Aliiroseovarius crassostreae]UWQ07505.1 hypothetical protein K3X25_12135 [Aliiroseovarius crassostreae]
MPIWMNVIVVLAMGLLVLWGMRGLARSIDHSMENQGDDDTSTSNDAAEDEDKT